MAMIIKNSDIVSYCFHMTCTKYLIILYLNIIILFQSFDHYETFKANQHDHKILDSCQRCKLLVESFKEGLRRTARGKHEGGDAHWEENRLNNYADSEIRLTEIQEQLCNDIKSGTDQCQSFAEKYETEIEDWFLKNRKDERKNGQEEGSTLFEYLCNQISESCCPDGHFGKDCKPCFGHPNNVCFNRGFCSGNGTRKGSGKCICHDGFAGDYCEKCSANYLAIGSIEIKMETEKLPKNITEKCVKCDQSCASSCHSLGPKGCHVCRNGYYYDNDRGCIDIDECNATDVELNPCKFQTYCVNTQGSYSCYPCHQSCKGCTGHGSNSCIECQSGYELVNQTCQQKDGYMFVWKLWQRVNQRYVSYSLGIAFIFIIALNNYMLSAFCLSIILSVTIALVEKPQLLNELL